MNVKLNISEDHELRAAVKELIKGQAMSIIRTELMDVIREELERKVKGYSSPFTCSPHYPSNNRRTWPYKPAIFTQDGKEWGLDYLTKQELDSLTSIK